VEIVFGLCCFVLGAAWMRQSISQQFEVFDKTFEKQERNHE